MELLVPDSASTSQVHAVPRLAAKVVCTYPSASFPGDRETWEANVSWHGATAWARTVHQSHGAVLVQFPSGGKADWASYSAGSPTTAPSFVGVQDDLFWQSGMQGGAWNTRTVSVSGPGGSISRPLGLPKCDAYFDKTEVWMGVNDNTDEGMYGTTGAGYGQVTDRDGNVGKYIVGGDSDLKDITLTVKVPGGGSGWVTGSVSVSYPGGTALYDREYGRTAISSGARPMRCGTENYTFDIEGLAGCVDDLVAEISIDHLPPAGGEPSGDTTSSSGISSVSQSSAQQAVASTAAGSGNPHAKTDAKILLPEVQIVAGIHPSKIPSGYSGAVDNLLALFPETDAPAPNIATWSPAQPIRLEVKITPDDWELPAGFVSWDTGGFGDLAPNTLIADLPTRHTGLAGITVSFPYLKLSKRVYITYPHVGTRSPWSMLVSYPMAMPMCLTQAEVLRKTLKEPLGKVMGAERADAFWHAYWSAWMAGCAVVGSEIAKDISRAFEWDDRASPNNPGTQAAEVAMDLHNNEQGISLGASYKFIPDMYPSPLYWWYAYCMSEIEDGVYDMLESGALWIRADDNQIVRSVRVVKGEPGWETKAKIYVTETHP